MRQGAGDWLTRQREIASRTIATNTALEATNVSVQRHSHSCLGTAVNLLRDSVRLVLLDCAGAAHEYLVAIPALCDAALADGEKWVYDDLEFARCQALRTAVVASWLGSADRFSGDAVATLTAWQHLAFREAVSNLTKRNATTIFMLLLAFVGRPHDASRLLSQVPIPPSNGAWLQLARLLAANADAEAWTRFIAQFVRAASADDIVMPHFDAAEAVMIAGVAVGGLKALDSPKAALKVLMPPS